MSCPNCASAVPAVGSSSQVGHGAGGELALQPPSHYRVCASCGARLIHHEGSGQGWQLVRTAEEEAAIHLDPAAGLGAAYLADVTPAGEDGTISRFVITDGGHLAHVDVEVSGSVAAMVGVRAFAPSVLERAVAARGLGLDRERARLAQLAAAGPLVLSADELERA
jgi:hypothetical protein